MDRAAATGAQPASGRADRLTPGRGRRCDATVMLCDLHGFRRTAAALDPDLVMEFVGGYQTRVAAAVVAAGGHADRFFADGMLASFGTPTGHSGRGDHALAAMAAAIRILSVLGQWGRERGEKVACGIILSTGPVIYGLAAAPPGDPRQEVVIVGPPVEDVLRLDGHPLLKQADIVCTAAAWERIGRVGGLPVDHLDIRHQADPAGGDLVAVSMTNYQP
ncbi:hypothetical protein V6768_07370 [Tistrella mobilis]